MEKVIARPTFNRKSGKWNVAVKTGDGKRELKLAYKVSNLLYKDTEFDTKKDAVEYIKNSDRLILENKMLDLLNKYSRN